MASCKECVHADMCRFYTEELAKTKGITLGEDIFEYFSTGDVCEHFKDRSRFVELPCKVGDTVYIYDPDLIYNPSVVEKAKVLLIQIHSKDDIRIFLCDEHCDKFWITLDTFIKGVKFNKEEAEQALKLKTGDTNA